MYSYNSGSANNAYMQAYQQSAGTSPYGGDNSFANSTMSHQYGEDYMQQEEEWEREGLLDPLWEKQQRKVRLRDIDLVDLDF